MKKTFLGIVALLTGASASADDFYLGIARATPGEAYADFAHAKQVRNYNSPAAYLIAGGYHWSQQFGAELGYGDFGTWKMADPTPGSKQEYRLSTSVLYAAVTSRMEFSNGLGVFGKLGLARNRYVFPTETVTTVRTMLGFGTSYALGKNLSAKLEYNYFGNTGKGSQEKAALGLSYGF